MRQPGTVPLDWLNFFLADVRDGLGPFLAVFLLTQQRWDEASIGVVMTAMGIASMIAQTPAGALVDATRWKRAIVVAATVVVAAACVAITLAPQFWIVLCAKAVMGLSAAMFAPTLAGLTLGLVGPAAFARRVGRNETFNHAGNASAAILAGTVGWLVSPVAVFYLVVAFGIGSVLCVLAIPGGAIDHRRARGLDAQSYDRPSGFRVLLESPPLLVFALCVTLFHFANAAMLPMVGEKLARSNEGAGTLYMSACIVGAQLVMIPMAVLAGRKADAWGRKALFLAGFAALPVRGVLYTMSDAPAWLLAVQLLDGIGAGIFGALFPVVVADLTRGTGHFNISQGAIATAQGIGAAISTSVAGYLQVRLGYDPAFLALAGIAAAALAVFALFMPETGPGAIPATSSEKRTCGPSSSSSAPISS